MHTQADIITKCLKMLGKYWNGATFAYPHYGNFKASSCKWNFSKMDAELLGRYMREWTEERAVLIGGCCGTTPEDILLIRNVCDEINKEK